MAGVGRNAVVAACLAHGASGVATLVGFFITDASSLLAAAIHGAAATGSGTLLLWGPSSKRLPARERYFWVCVATIALFVAASTLALLAGIQRLQRDATLESLPTAFAILGASSALQAWSSWTTLMTARPELQGRGWWRSMGPRRGVELPLLLWEGLGALLGLVIALAALLLVRITGEPYFDALGAAAIGVLLAMIAALVALQMRASLVDETAPESVGREIEQALLATPGVQHIVQLKALQVGSQELLIVAKVEFDNTLAFETLTERITAAEERIREVLSCPAQIFLEPDVYDPARRRTQRKDSGFFHRVKLD